MDLGFDVVVTITGIVLVFLILVLLMAIITLLHRHLPQSPLPLRYSRLRPLLR